MILSTSEELRGAILSQGTGILKAWIGKDENKRQILAVLVAGKNLLLEGPAGSGKTLIAKELAKALPDLAVVNCDFNCDPEVPRCPRCTDGGGVFRTRRREILTMPGARRFVRIQGSPELTAEDLVGDMDPTAAFKYGPFDIRAFKPGKIIKANRKIIFIDEVNRLSERLQNTLLQVLQEHIMTIGGFDFEFAIDTVLIGTMNPEEHAGVYRLSEALKDRLERVRITYPTPEEEVEIVKAYGADMGAQISEELERKIVEVVQRTRRDESVSQPASVRATISIAEVAQSFALLRCSKTVELEDVRKASLLGLSGRVLMSPDSSLYEHPEKYIEGLVRDILGAV